MTTVRAFTAFSLALLMSCAVTQHTRSSDRAPERFTDIQLYAEAVQKKIRGHVVLPASVPSSATALVNLSLSETGLIAELSLTRSSGYALYDDSITTAIVRSQPLPLLVDSAGRQIHKALQLTFTAGE